MTSDVAAKACSKCGVEKPRTEFSKDRRRKDGLRSHCKQCQREFRAAWHEANRERERERCREWYEANAERVRERNAAWYAANAERVREYNAAWREANRGYQAAWREANRERRREYGAARRAAKLQRTPAWADREAIKAIYDEAQKLTEVLGIDHHVDHIEPLRGDTVCGLHVAENLRVVPAVVNLRKGNLAFEEYQFRELL